MKDQIPVKSRILATSLHAIASIPAISIIVILTSIMMFEHNIASVIPSSVTDFIPTSLHYLLIEPVTSETISNIGNVSMEIILSSTIATILMWKLKYLH
jgi:Na+/glutamate symporter